MLGRLCLENVANLPETPTNQTMQLTNICFVADFVETQVVNMIVKPARDLESVANLPEDPPAAAPGRPRARDALRPMLYSI